MYVCVYVCPIIRRYVLYTSHRYVPYLDSTTDHHPTRNFVYVIYVLSIHIHTLSLSILFVVLVLILSPWLWLWCVCVGLCVVPNPALPTYWKKDD